MIFERDTAGAVPITHVFETHIHNDYVTGGLALAQRCGATYVLNADDPVRFERFGIRDGESISTGTLTVTAIHTPGHTPTHLSYAVAVDGAPIAVFTGGSMLFGAMGRTDLVDPARTEELTRAQHQSAHRLAAILPDETEICAAQPGRARRRGSVDAATRRPRRASAPTRAWRVDRRSPVPPRVRGWPRAGHGFDRTRGSLCHPPRLDGAVGSADHARGRHRRPDP